MVNNLVSIRRCKKNEILSVMNFINTYWSENHVLATSQSLMDWQHKSKNGYNYLLAWNEDVLVGILGYIPTCRYDKALNSQNILWLSLWKVRDDFKSAALGLRLLKALETVENNIGLAVNGINSTHPPMYRALGYQVYDLIQYYLVNTSRPQNILQSPNNYPLAIPSIGNALLVRMYSNDLLSLKLSHEEVVPFKTPSYFIKRFLEHPFYDYKVYGVVQDDNIRAIIAIRIVYHMRSCVLRIIDFFGDTNVIGDCGSAFSKLMNEFNAEYIDFWQYGISSNVLSKAGFEAIDPNGKLICPNYFEPFKANNERVTCCIKSKTKISTIVCRADGDQDRPNMLAL